MTPDQRDIVLVPVPFTDLSATKRRPVVVLSKTSHNRKASDLLVAAITSNLTAGGPGVVITSSDLSSGRLPVDSLVRVDKLYALSKSIIVKRYGRLSTDSFAKALTALDGLLGRLAEP